MPAGGPVVGATLVAKARTGVSLIGFACRRVSEGLRERGARVGTTRSNDSLATSPKGELQ
eukprot:12440912-Heterocapsa_arctica.AAC.1